MTAAAVAIPLYLNQIELNTTKEIELQKYYIYQYINRPETYIVYIGEQREQGVVFRQTTLDRVIVNVEQFLTLRPAVCL